MTAPKRELFKAPEVCEMAQLQPYVLRTWEAEFPSLGQVPAGGGPRIYRRSDVEQVLLIKQLVFGEGLTLAGARRRLEEESQPSVAPAVGGDDVLDGLARTRLREVRNGLEAILKLLDRHGDRGEPELQLVPPEHVSRSTTKAASGKRRKAS